MIGSVKLRAKELLIGCTGRLFGTSLLSFVLRWGLLGGFGFGIWELFWNGDARYLLMLWREDVMTALLAVVLAICLYTVLALCAGLRLGEERLYYSRAEGNHGSFRLLFCYLSPKKSFHALRLYVVLAVRKLLWLLLYMTPAAAGGVFVWFFSKSQSLSTAVYYTLIGGVSLLFTVSLFYCGTVSQRYSAAPYYFCLSKKKSVRSAISKSVRFTDGFLKDGAVLRFTMSGWVLLCSLIVPFIYVVPYFHLANACLTVRAVTLHTAIPQRGEMPLCIPDPSVQRKKA